MTDQLPITHGRRSSAGLAVLFLLFLIATSAPPARAAAAPSPGAGSSRSRSASSGLSSSELGSSVASLTGTDDAGAVRPQSLCSAAPPGYASCAAEALVSRASRAPIHPRVRRAYPAARTRTNRPREVGAVPMLEPAVAQADTEPAAAPLPQAGTPAFIEQAYDLSALSETAGGDATVGIVDAYDDTTAASDLAAYRAEFHLPACTTGNGCLTIDAQTTTTNSGWAFETSLDLDAVSAVCPNCHIVLVEASSASLDALLNAIQAAHTLGATYISNSWGEDDGSLSDDGFSFSGSTTFAAAGDSGYTGSPEYPAALPDVTAVGGTTLTYAPQNARGYTEAAWNGNGGATGSGCDTSQAKPSWQTGDNTGCSGRSYNDISADADPDTGIDVYDTGYGGWVVAGGTSLATPLTAAYYALIGNDDGGQAWPYQHASLLGDVTYGNDVFTDAGDPWCSDAAGICQAGVGFDGPTGNGTISGDVVAGAPGVGSNGYSEGVADGSASVMVGVYPNGADTQVYLEYGPSGEGYSSQTTTQDIGSGPTAVEASFALSGVEAGYHYRVVATNSYGTTYGYDVSLGDATDLPVVSSAGVSTATPQATYSVNFNGSGNLYVEYGTSTSYGLTSQVESGSGAVSGALALGGLAPDTTYHWAIVVSNGSGAFATPDGNFTTPASAPAVPASSAGSGSAASGSSPGTGSTTSSRPSQSQPRHHVRVVRRRRGRHRATPRRVRRAPARSRPRASSSGKRRSRALPPGRS